MDRVIAGFIGHDQSAEDRQIISRASLHTTWSGTLPSNWSVIKIRQKTTVDDRINLTAFLESLRTFRTTWLWG